ncbi:MAG TPA: hypothetical protein VFW39_02235 [Sphingomicrobium sp.]|nr:hypothetical protein [Sphingomicrobium sp.]
MKHILSGMAFLSILLLPQPLSAQTVSGNWVTYSSSGIFDGKEYNSLSFNYSNDEVRMNFTDGTTFTQVLPFEDFWGLLELTIDQNHGGSFD